jgi:hypothetical protein
MRLPVYPKQSALLLEYDREVRTHHAILDLGGVISCRGNTRCIADGDVTMSVAPPKFGLAFSLRIDVSTPLVQMRTIVERALGCQLVPGDWNRLPFLQTELLGMRILLGETRGTRGQPVYQIHGITEVPVEEIPGYEGPESALINEVVIDLLERAGGGSWHVPTLDEIRAEARI